MAFYSRLGRLLRLAQHARRKDIQPDMAQKKEMIDPRRKNAMSDVDTIPSTSVVFTGGDVSQAAGRNEKKNRKKFGLIELNAMPISERIHYSHSFVFGKCEQGY
jgi:hypothetical protein